MVLVRDCAGSLRWLIPLKDRGTLGVEDCSGIVETRVSNVMPGKSMDRYSLKKLIARRFLCGLNIASKCTSSICFQSFDPLGGFGRSESRRGPLREHDVPANHPVNPVIVP